MKHNSYSKLHAELLLVKEVWS